MTSSALPLTQTSEEERFKMPQVLPVVAAHFANDLYSSFVAPLLPVFIEKLSLSLTLAGSLTAIMQVPAVLNPLIGYYADRMSVRYFVIFAPAITGTLISLMGFAPGYFPLAVLLFAAGVSVAAFHAPAPAMVARVSGRRVGLGMSLFMAGGELSFTVGPLLAVWAVSSWGLQGIWRTVIFGWAATLVLYWRLRNVSAKPEKPDSLRNILPLLTSLFLPLALANLTRYPLLECLYTYMPTYMKSLGYSLWISGATLSVIELAGVAGVLLSGPVSDRLGRKQVLLAGSIASSILLLVFLKVSGWLVIPVLLLLGFTALSATPVMLAIVQENFPKNRAVANGVFMLITFLLRPLGTLMIGVLGDHYGLQTAFLWGALISFLALPAIWKIPEGTA